MRISNRLLIFLVIFVNVLWGGAFIALKIALDSFTTEQVLLGRVAFAALLYLLLLPGCWKDIHYRKGDWKWLAVAVACEPCLLFTFETLGLGNTTASQASMIVACAPLATAAAGFVFLREKVSRRCLGGICLAVLGVVLVSGVNVAGESAPNPLLGNFFMLCAVCTVAAMALVMRRLTRQYPVIFLSGLQTFGGTLFFLPLALRSPWPQSVSPASWGAIVYLGFGVTFLVYLVLNYSLSRLKAGHAMIFANIIPIAGLVLAFLILGERMLPLQYFGSALVLAGIVVAGPPEDSAGDGAENAAERTEEPLIPAARTASGGEPLNG